MQGETEPLDDMAREARAAQEFAANMARVAEQSQAIWARMVGSQTADTGHAMKADPLNIVPAFAELAQALMSRPERLAEATLDLWSRQTELWRRATLKAFGADEAPMIAPAPGDKRFKHQDWSQNALFDYLKQSYLLTAGIIQNTVRSAEDMDERDKKKVEFYTRNFIEAMSPSNFFALNPEVLHATVEEKGENLVRGLTMMLEDLERGKGKLLIRQTDMDAFAIGRNMALTPGKVVFRNPLFELIQYAPATETVHEIPLLIIPPWINKFYILDLNPQKSLVRWLVEQGHTVFLVSWVNPDEHQRDETWDSYTFNGGSVAIDKVLEETGAPQLNLAAYCIGGTMAGTMLAYFGKVRDRRVRSATFFTAQLDFEDAGELQVLVDERTLGALEGEGDRGYFPAEGMAQAFNMLRASDLVWGYMVSNYLLGKEPFPFDLLYWNSDSTRMAIKVHGAYLDAFYRRNAFAAGDFKVAGSRVTLADIHVPVYHVAAKEDHIAPAASVYRGAKAMTGAEVRFVLAGSGHIAGVVNPPAAGKYQFWTNPDMTPEDLPGWLAGAVETPGSWWTDWDRWLAGFSTARVPARTPGQVLAPLEDAPGSYVRVRFDAPVA